MDAGNEELGTWEAAVCWLRDQPQSEALVLAAYLDDPLDAAAERYWRSEEWACVRALIGARRGRALDVGAGRGIASYALVKDGFEVTALEPDPSAIVGAAAIRSLAEGQGLAIQVTEELSEKLPFDDQSFDVVFARAVLHHIGDLDAAMREFRRVLKPGGLFIAIREHVLSRDEDLPDFLAVHPLHHRFGGENAFRLEVYTRAIEKAGLRLRRVITPLENPINFSPHTTAELSREIAARFVPVPLLSDAAALAIRSPVLGARLRRMAARFDHRPGRPYSFVADRPAGAA